MDSLASDLRSDKVCISTVRTVIKNRLGLHARAAAKLATVAGNFKSAVVLSKDELEADARSILSLLSLGCGYNSEVVVTCAGEDSKACLAALTEVIDKKFGED
ncbi:MAG: HPr family phosphocarrier protein [Deltaproteobacteria bacterium]|jgi:phosphocarrier protein|nr:HPr family phosphocarrier protein [Deltaproteobacteria bacterium]